MLGLLLPPPLLHLLPARHFHLLLQRLPAPFLLLEQLQRLLLGLPDLLIEDLVLLVPHALQDLRLPLNQLLPLRLLLRELQILPVLLQLVHLLLLRRVDLDPLLLLQLHLPLPLLVRQQLRVCPTEGLLLLLLLVLTLPFLLSLSLELLFDLPVDEVGLESLLLDALDVVHLELVELLGDRLGVLLLPIELRYQLRLHLLIVRLHLRPVKLLPFLLESLFMIGLPLLVVLLDVSLGEYIRIQKLALECLDYVLVVVRLLVGAHHHLHALLLLQLELQGVNATALDLLSFQASVAIFHSLFAEGLHGVGPVGDPSLRFLLQGQPLHGPLRLIVQEFGLREATSCALLADALQFVNSDDGHVAVHEGVGPLDAPAQSVVEDVLGGTIPEDIPVAGRVAARAGLEL